MYQLGRHWVGQCLGQGKSIGPMVRDGECISWVTEASRMQRKDFRSETKWRHKRFMIRFLRHSDSLDREKEDSFVKRFSSIEVQQNRVMVHRQEAATPVITQQSFIHPKANRSQEKRTRAILSSQTSNLTRNLFFVSSLYATTKLFTKNPLVEARWKFLKFQIRLCFL